MSARQLINVLVVMAVVMSTERVREAHQPAQGASELGVRMLEDAAVHARRGCGGDRVKMQRATVWLNMQSRKVRESTEKQREEEGERRRSGLRAVCTGAAERRSPALTRSCSAFTIQPRC